MSTLKGLRGYIGLSLLWVAILGGALVSGAAAGD